VNGHRCELVSRNGHRFKSWPQLAEEIAHAVRAKTAVLDGEICCLDSDGRSNFRNLLFRREWPYLFAFDLLMLEGEDLRSLPLLERKYRLARIMPRVQCRLMYLDHIHERGSDLFRVACEGDVEGIVGKWAAGTYQRDQRSTSWLKVKNSDYSQMRDRHELFEPRQSDRGVGRRSLTPTLRLI
jgi:bifunctional non-homologous end joining protein LigD